VSRKHNEERIDGVWKTVYSYAKNETGPLSYTIYKKRQSCKVIRRNRGINLQDIFVGNDILDMIPTV
jgi:hypothetical protein